MSRTNQISSPISLSFPTGNFRKPFPARVRAKTRVCSSWWGRSARATPAHSTAPRSSPASSRCEMVTRCQNYKRKISKKIKCIFDIFNLFVFQFQTLSYINQRPGCTWVWAKAMRIELTRFHLSSVKDLGWMREERKQAENCQQQPRPGIHLKYFSMWVKIIFLFTRNCWCNGNRAANGRMW